MRKMLLPIIPLIVVILLGIAFLVFDSNRPPDWQADLDRYLGYQHAEFNEVYQVVSIAEARKPWDFLPEMSRRTYGASPHYQTDIDYGVEMPDPEVEPGSSLDAPAGNRMPLPFPPQAIWCVLLANDDSTMGTGDIVLVALHQDLYNADYIIHEISDGSQIDAPDHITRVVGCDLP